MQPCQNPVRLFAVALTVAVEQKSLQQFRFEGKRPIVGKQFPTDLIDFMRDGKLATPE